MKKSMLIDNSKCIGCRACQAAQTVEPASGGKLSLPGLTKPAPLFAHNLDDRLPI